MALKVGMYFYLLSAKSSGQHHPMLDRTTWIPIATLNRTRFKVVKKYCMITQWLHKFRYMLLSARGLTWCQSRFELFAWLFASHSHFYHQNEGWLEIKMNNVVLLAVWYGQPWGKAQQNRALSFPYIFNFTLLFPSLFQLNEIRQDFSESGLELSFFKFK